MLLPGPCSCARCILCPSLFQHISNNIGINMCVLLFYPKRSFTGNGAWTTRQNQCDIVGRLIAEDSGNLGWKLTGSVCLALVKLYSLNISETLKILLGSLCIRCNLMATHNRQSWAVLHLIEEYDLRELKDAYSTLSWIVVNFLNKCVSFIFFTVALCKHIQPIG